MRPNNAPPSHQENAGPTIAKKSVRGGLIALAVTFLNLAVSLGTQILLARMLTPECFGAVAFALVVVLFCSSLCNTHGNRFVIKEQSDVVDKLNNVFTMEMITAGTLLLSCFFLAPLLMAILGKPELTRLLQSLLVLLFRNPMSLPKALLEKDLDFARAHTPLLAGQVIGAAVGIAVVVMGGGIWGLVAWRVLALAGEVAILWCLAPVRPRFALNVGIVRGILSFGWPLMGSSILVFFYWNVDYYIVGRILGNEALGYYWLAFQMSHHLLKARTAINSVVFPSFSKMETRDQVRRGFDLLTRSTLIVFLLPTILVCVTGHDLVLLLMGEQWLPAVPVLKIFMVLTTIRATIGFWDPVCLRYGKTHLMLIATVWNAAVILALGVPAARAYGIEGVACVVLFTLLCMVPFIAYMMHKMIRASYFRLLSGPICIALGLGGCFFFIYNTLGSDWPGWGKLTSGVVFAALFTLAFFPDIKKAMRHGSATA